jgi:hypothetical protein
MMLRTMRIADIGIQIFELVQVMNDTMIAKRIKPIDDGKSILLLLITTFIY